MKKILVSYFSASGVTARVAQKLSQAIDGDLHEIIPAQPYSQADLDWTNVAPTIINTFLEQYDLSGKTIIPFATSGGSGMGNTTQELKVSCGNAKLCQGRRFDSQVDVDTLKTWAESFL